MALHRGRFARHPKVLEVRPLTVEDLACLRQKRVGPPRVRAIRESHHRLARLVAYGYKDHEIVRITGYSSQRVATLKADPSIQQLVEQYRPAAREKEIRQLDHDRERKFELMRRAESQMLDHFDAAEESNELLPLKTLLSISGDMSDRIGLGKHTSTTTEYRDFAKLMELEMVHQGQSLVIDAKVVNNSATPSPGIAGGSVPSITSPNPSAPVAGLRRRIS